MRKTLLLLAACVAVASAQSFTAPTFSTNSRIATELDLTNSSKTINMEERTITTNFDGSSDPMTLVSAVGPDSSLKALIQGEDKITMLTSDGCSRLSGSDVPFIPDVSSGESDSSTGVRKYYLGLRDLADNNDLSSATFDRSEIFRGIQCNVFTLNNVQKTGSAYDLEIFVPVAAWEHFGKDASGDSWIAAVRLSGILCPSENETCSKPEPGSNSTNATQQVFEQVYNFFAPFSDDDADESPSLEIGLLGFCPLFTASSSNSSDSSNSTSGSVSAPTFPLKANAQVLVTKVGDSSSILTSEAWSFAEENSSSTAAVSARDLNVNGWIVKKNAGFANQTVFAVSFERNLTFALNGSSSCEETDLADEEVDVVENDSPNLLELPDVLLNSTYAKLLLSNSSLNINGLVDLYLIANQLNLTYNGQRFVRGIKCNTWFASFDMPILEKAEQSNETSSSAVVAPSSSVAASSSIVASSSVAASPSASVATSVVATATASVSVSLVPVGSSIRQANQTSNETSDIQVRKFMLVMDVAVSDWSFSESAIELDSTPVRFQLLELSANASSGDSSADPINFLAWTGDDLVKATTEGIIENNWIYDIFSISGGVPSNRSLLLPEFVQCPSFVPESTDEIKYYPELVPEFISFIDLLDTVTPQNTFIQTWWTNETDALRFSFYDDLDLDQAFIIRGTTQQLYTLTPEDTSAVCNAQALQSSLNPFLTPAELSGNASTNASTPQWGSSPIATTNQQLQELVTIFGRLDLVNASHVGTRTIRGIETSYWLGYVTAQQLWFGVYYAPSFSSAGSGGDLESTTQWIPFRLEVFKFGQCDDGSTVGQCGQDGFLGTEDDVEYDIHRIYDFVGLSDVVALPPTVINPPVCFPASSSPSASASESVSASASATVSATVTVIASPSVATSLPSAIEARRRALDDNVQASSAGHRSGGLGLGTVLGIAASTLLVGAVIGGAVIMTYRRRRAPAYAPLSATAPLDMVSLE